MDHTLDPLASSELQRALAFARARESYPGIPSELLLELCDAAWERAAGEAGDGRAVDRFERAMQLVARGYRVGGGRISVAEVAEQAIPRAALRRYVRPANARPAPVEEEEPMRERRPLSERLARIPMARPAPVGASVAAGLFGFVAAAQAGVLPAGPLGFAGVGDDGSSSHVRPEGDHAQQSSKRAGAPTTLGQAASPPRTAPPATPSLQHPGLTRRTGPGPAARPSPTIKRQRPSHPATPWPALRSRRSRSARPRWLPLPHRQRHR